MAEIIKPDHRFNFKINNDERLLLREALYLYIHNNPKLIGEKDRRRAKYLSGILNGNDEGNLMPPPNPSD